MKLYLRSRPGLGTIERSQKVSNEFLRAYVNEHKTDWDVYIPFFEFCFNTTLNSTHGYTPFELNHRYNADKFNTEHLTII